MRIKTNEDKQKVEEIRKKLKENNGYCPTKKAHICDNICICTEFIEQGLGECSCGLYVKLDK